MDNLAKEAVIARASGMSYGKWKAMQNPTKIEPKVDPNIKKCLNCGAEIVNAGNRARQYCDSYCGSQYRGRGNGVAGKPGAKQCPECGAEFTANSNSRKYCGQECYAAAIRRRALERRKRGKTNGKKAKSSLG